MASLPSNLGLTNIADGASIIASDHRNNYSAIQTAVNSLLSLLGGGTSGQILTSGGGTTVGYAAVPGSELAYTEFTATVNVTGTGSGSATSVCPGAATTYDGTAVIVEFFAIGWDKGTTNINLELYDGTSSQGVVMPALTSSGIWPIYFRRKLTPGAGSHTYNVKAWVDAGTGHVYAGAGGSAGANIPGFLRVTKV